MSETKDSVAFIAKVRSVEEKVTRMWVKGVGEQAEFVEQRLGWYVLLEDSHESFFTGMTRPNIEVGDRAVIRISFYGRE